MNHTRSIRLLTIVAALGCALLIPTHAVGQFISLKTVPVAAGDQFLLHPSANLGMGSISLAYDDPLLDPFVNPAKGGRIETGSLFASPVFYGISNGNGSGRTIPVGGLFRGERWFGGFSASVQEIESAERNNWLWQWRWIDGPQSLSEASGNNIYASAFLGMKVPEKGLSLGIGASLADLEAMDGVDLLYAMSERIEQSGSIADLRAGLLKEWSDDRSLELLLLYNRFRMTHDVTYLDWVWNPEEPDGPAWQTRVEENLDRTNTWGVHTQYVQPLTETGWRIGWLFTANRKSHPKIPNYEIQNIPRDPGDSWAYNFGVGLARTQDFVSYGIDLIYEPIWSDTWAEADTAVTTTTGNTILPGEKTVENDFRFSNMLIRLGVGGSYRQGTVQLGLQVRSIRYELEQFNNVEVFRRDQEESWMEWTPTWGASVDLDQIQVRYAGRTTTGTGRPGIEWTAERMGGVALAEARDFIVAPSGPLTLQDARVTTHQLSVSIPVR